MSHRNCRLSLLFLPIPKLLNHLFLIISAIYSCLANMCISTTWQAVFWNIFYSPCTLTGHWRQVILLFKMSHNFCQYYMVDNTPFENDHIHHSIAFYNQFNLFLSFQQCICISTPGKLFILERVPFGMRNYWPAMKAEGGGGASRERQWTLTDGITSLSSTVNNS